jgi:phosphoenolpyruvate carboxylase
MGSLLGKVVQEHEGPELFAKVEELRHLAKTWRESKSNAAFAQMAQFVQQLSHAELYKVSRSFTHFLAIANAAESHHRARRVQQQVVAGHAKPDSCAGAIPALLQQGHAPEQILQALATQTTELVLTAHPTEVNRRTILEKKRRIQKILTTADSYRASGNGSAFALQQLDDALYREISSLWLSDEVSRLKPTPEKEAEKGTLVLETVLWEALPQWMRQLDDTCRRYLGRSLPLTAAPVRLASWMGGDRDGNPNVTPNTTRHVCLRNRQKAAALLHHDLQQLESELSITTCSPELRAALLDDNAREPYRAYLRPMIRKLERTMQWAADGLEALQQQESPKAATPVQSVIINKSDIYLSTQEFLDELLLMHRSLVDTNNEIVADGLLKDLLRKVSAFGLSLVPLDVRQESDRHEEALDAITRYLGLGRYAQWDEETKIAWLTNQISGKRPLLRPGVWRHHPDVFSPTACDTLEIMQMIAEQPEGSLGAYVISQATSASDVLAVLLLQLDAGVQKPLRVAPLFETLNDLKGAGDTMKKLFSLPVYMGVIQGKQEVMIGYSDSAKGECVWMFCVRLLLLVLMMKLHYHE